MSIQLWAARLERSLTEEETQVLLRLLPPERRERLLRIRQPEKRREPLCAYLLLRMALREVCGWRDLPAIALTSLGKPWFPDAVFIMAEQGLGDPQCFGRRALANLFFLPQQGERTGKIAVHTHTSMKIVLYTIFNVQ